MEGVKFNYDDCHVSSSLDICTFPCYYPVTTTHYQEV
jgi:hypothetical protein